MRKPDIDAAQGFIAANARVVDRRRFERMFAGGEAAPVRAAVAAYQNADGGFGQGLEPDCRAPGSQPLTVAIALRIMDEADAWDESLAVSACDWLTTVEPAGGGAAFVEPTIDGWPHAPWWAPQDGHPATPIATGQLAGTLHARGFSHPWLDRATSAMWTMIDGLSEPGPYDMLGIVQFLQHVPDRDRAQSAFDQVSHVLRNPDVVALDPAAPGEVHSPLEFAPEPGWLARDLFDKQVIDAHLDHLVQSQRDDGGWTFNWLAWSPAAERDWQGFITVDTLRILRANGRL
jgi:hypothetical protein